MERSEREIILLVDDNVANLKVGKNALVKDYDVYTATSAAKMFELLAAHDPSLILLDIDMPVMNGYDALKLIKQDERTKGVPVIFLTAKADMESEVFGLELGAVDYIYKPFIPSLLKKRVEVHIKTELQRRMLADQAEVLESYMGNLHSIAAEQISIATDLQDRILRVVADLVESRDDNTGGHVRRTQEGVRIFIEALRDEKIYVAETRDWNIPEVIRSSQLHDVGKIYIADNILKKTSRLTNEEFVEMQKHTTLGVEIIDKMSEGVAVIEYLQHARIFAGTHHEKWDGSGYPAGLAGEQIPLQGRIMAFADVYDALVSERPYKKPFSHESAVNIILEGAGTHFDPVLSSIFEKIAWKFEKVV